MKKHMPLHSKNEQKKRFVDFRSGFQFIKNIFSSRIKDSTDSNNTFLNIFHSSNAIMLVIEPQENGDHNIIDANRSAEEFYGYSRSELLNLHIGEINQLKSEDRQRLMKETLQKNSNTVFFKHKLANNEIRDVQVTASPININGKKSIFIIVHDLSEQVNAVQKSKEQQEFAQALFNLSPDGMFLMNTNGHIIDGNKAALILIGEEKENIISKNLLEIGLLSDEDKARFSERLRQIKNGIPTEYQEYTFNRSDGSQILIEGKTEVISNKGVKYLLGTMRDITERNLQQHKLKESKAKYKYLADFTFEWEYWVSPEGNYIYNSPSCEKTTGYPVSAFAENPNLLSEITLPEYKDAVHQHMSKEKSQVMEHKMEFQILKPNGEKVWIEHSCKPIHDAQGVFLGKRGINRNITTEKKAKDLLRDSNERFKMLSQLTFEGILIHKNGIIQDTNLALEKLSGYKREEIINKSLFDLIKTEDLKKSAEKSIKKEYAEPYETIIRKKNGTIIEIEIEAKSYAFNNEEYRVAAIRDITEKKKTMNTLSFLNKALQNSKEVVFTTDKEGVFNYINPEFTNLYGYTEEEVIGKATPRILKSGKTADMVYSTFWNKLLSKENLNSTYVNKSKNNTLIDIEATADPILDESGNIIGFLALQHDITERKKRELRQEVISSIIAVVIQDLELKDLLHYIQNELNKLMDARNFYFALYHKDSETFTLPFYSDSKDDTSFFNAKGSLTGYLIEQRKPLLVNSRNAKKLKADNKIKCIGKEAKQWLGVPLFKNKEVIGAFVIQSYTNENAYNKDDVEVMELIANQISLAMERKNNEASLRKALVQAQESDRLKSTFLATMSHELRTPLNAIIGFSDLAEEERSKDEIISFSKIINNSGNHLLGIVNEIFDLTLLETGEIKLSYADYTIDSIFENLLLISQKEQLSLNKMGIKLFYSIPEEYKNLIIKTDNQRLQQVLINLLKNALKFTDSGSIEYGFEIIEKKNTPVIQFYVKDTGIGIAKEKQEIIFDVFRQADDSHSRKHDGVGLGLSISKKIISLMGGQIWLNSETNQGSNFYFDLPCTLSYEDQESEYLSTLTRESLNQDSLTLLIAEDEEANYFLLEYMLAPLKAKLIWAKDGQETIDLLKQNPSVDLILMDIRMNNMNGLEATRIIKKSHPTLPIIAQTAYAISGDKELALKEGCDDYITKPIDKSELLEMIAKHLS